MLSYFEKYAIIACVVGVAVPLVVSTVYPMVTNEILAAHLWGMFLLIALLLVTLYVMSVAMSKLADKVAQGYIDHYDKECDPQRMLDESASLRAAMQPPYNPAGAWFSAYSAQALLDVGHADEAKRIEEGLRQSIAHEKKPSRKADIIVNLVPLAMKIDGPEAVRDDSALAISFLDAAGAPPQDPRRLYLQSQIAMAAGKLGGDEERLIDLYEKIIGTGHFEMRLRVESAWDEARIFYRRGEHERERACLEFVVKYGNKLALVGQAQARLATL